MSKPAKIIILLAALMATFLAVVLFAKTKAQPPANMNFPNPHKSALEKEINSMTDALSDNDLFSVIVSKLKFQSNENVINASQHDSVADLLITQYVPLFRQACWSCFETDDWESSRIDTIQKRAIALKSLRKKTTSDVVLNNHVLLSNQVDSIVGIIDDYYYAVDLVQKPNYVSFEKSRIAVLKAHELKKKYPISNCKSLVSKLDSLPYQMERSHYNYLVSMINRLHFHNLPYYWNKRNGYDSFEYFVATLNDNLQAYKENTSFYPRHHYVEDLEDSVYVYHQRALNYYFISNKESRTK